jgi:AcrR family transcriptional regulator
MPKLTLHARRELVQERQSQILEAAARVFAEKGFARATIRDVARAAGVSQGSIYLYFKNKQDLLVHLPRQFIQPQMEAFLAAGLGTDTPPAPDVLLGFIAQNIVKIMTQNRELMQVLFTSLATMDDATRETYVREVPLYAMEHIETYIRAQQAAGVFRSELDATIVSRLLPGMMVFFLLVQEIIQPANMERIEYERLIPTVVNVFLHGVMNPNAPAPEAPLAVAASKPKPKPRVPNQKIAIE